MSYVVLNINYQKLVQKCKSFDAYQASIKNFFDDKDIWSEAREKNSKVAYEEYIKQFPNGLFVDQAQRIIDTEEQLWHQIQNQVADLQQDKEKVKRYHIYFKETKLYAYQHEAANLIKELQLKIADEAEENLWQETVKKVQNIYGDQEKIRCYENYLTQTQLRKYANEANEAAVKLKSKILREYEEIIWQKANVKQSDKTLFIKNLKNYLSVSKLRKYAEAAQNKIAKLEQETACEEEEKLWQTITEKVKKAQNNDEKIKFYKEYLLQTKLHRYTDEIQAFKNSVANEYENEIWQKAHLEQHDKLVFINNLKNYIVSSTLKHYVEKAERKIAKLEQKIADEEDTALWEKIQQDAEDRFKNEEKIKIYSTYLQQTRLSKYTLEADQKIKELQDEESLWKNTQQKANVDSYKAYLNKSALKTYQKEAEKALEKLTRFYRDDQKEVVIDKKTGLMWQDDKIEKQVKGLFGFNTKVEEMRWEKAMKYAENLEFAGYGDWRVPTIEELKTIVDYTRYDPAIKQAFKHVVSSYYWSSSVSVSSASSAWSVYFKNGDTSYNDKSYKYRVRCVRAGQYFGSLNFKRDETKEIVKDLDSNLMWQDSKEVTQNQMTSKEAQIYAQKLNQEKFAGYDDWRVPTIEELKTIVDYTRYKPAIKQAFKHVVSSDYWSSTTVADDAYVAWGVFFYDGYDYWSTKDNSAYVRCVRGGQ